MASNKLRKDETKALKLTIDELFDDALDKSCFIKDQNEWLARVISEFQFSIFRFVKDFEYINPEIIHIFGEMLNKKSEELALEHIKDIKECTQKK